MCAANFHCYVTTRPLALDNETPSENAQTTAVEAPTAKTGGTP